MTIRYDREAQKRAREIASMNGKTGIITFKEPIRVFASDGAAAHEDDHKRGTPFRSIVRAVAVHGTVHLSSDPFAIEVFRIYVHEDDCYEQSRWIDYPSASMSPTCKVIHLGAGAVLSFAEDLVL